MHVSSLFDRRVPPITSFSMGTLGFLSPFHFKDYQQALTNVLSSNVSILPRLRLECTAYDEHGQIYPQASKSCFIYHDILTYLSLASIQVMNEVNLHRGSYPHLTSLNCFINGQFLTNAIADGLMIATPTGSTAYSLSAGGPIVHPSVSSLLLTPVCPQSLSFRPVLLPSDVIIQLKVSKSNRSLAALSIDGRDICLLPPGAMIKIQQSPYPLPSVNRIHEGVDWVRDINQMLKFNQGFTNKHQINTDWEE
jgi:NADH kinase